GEARGRRNGRRLIGRRRNQSTQTNSKNAVDVSRPLAVPNSRVVGTAARKHGEFLHTGQIGVELNLSGRSCPIGGDLSQRDSVVIARGFSLPGNDKTAVTERCSVWSPLSSRGVLIDQNLRTDQGPRLAIDELSVYVPAVGGRGTSPGDENLAIGIHS